jgi:hypothetical protein
MYNVSLNSGFSTNSVVDLSSITVFHLTTAVNSFRNFLPSLGAQMQKGVLEAMAMAVYQAQKAVPVVALLLCNDAPQFPGLTSELALCWVHG